MFDLALHFLIFIIAGSVAFVLLPLLIGQFVRPDSPTPEKVATYECGEPTIGSSYVQFDIRFYVVALLFIIFDVEVAFFFPWATVRSASRTASAESSSDAVRSLIRQPQRCPSLRL